MYSKVSPNMSTSLPYFSLHDPSYSSSRLVALQHQLHVTTNSSLELAPRNAWSNLIIPYHPSLAIPNSQTSDQGVREMTVTENREKQEKRKNPYSIEELLKKPDKKIKPPLIADAAIHQPYGVLVNNDEDNEEKCANSDSEAEQDVKIDVD